MRLTKTIGAAGALILSALVGGTLIGSAIATDNATDTDATSVTAEYCETFMDGFASELGVTREAVVTAGRSAATAAIDTAVAARDLGEERADALRERINSADGIGCGWFGHGFGRGFDRGLERGMTRGFLNSHVLEAAADALEIERSALITQLRDAESLEAVADDLAVSYDDVTASVLAAVRADLDAAVTEGMDQAHADSVIERLTTWLHEGGELRGSGRGGHGRGGWHHRGSDEAPEE